MKVKILINDPGKRFRVGEIGEVLENDFPKYDYKIQLPGRLTIPFGGGEFGGPRIYYFHADEVKKL